MLEKLGRDEISDMQHGRKVRFSIIFFASESVIEDFRVCRRVKEKGCSVNITQREAILKSLSCLTVIVLRHQSAE